MSHLQPELLPPCFPSSLTPGLRDSAPVPSMAKPCAVGLCWIQPGHHGYQFSPMEVLVKMAEDSMAWSNTGSWSNTVIGLR